MLKIPCKDKFGNLVADLRLDTTMTAIISAALRLGRINPWYLVDLTISGKFRSVYVKVISGVPTEAQYVD